MNSFREERQKRETDKIMIPGDLQQALNHRLSCMPGTVEPGSEVCEYSRRFINRKQLSIFCDTKDLEFIGPGIPLFFKFVRNCILILFLTMIIQSAYTLYLYRNSDNCKTLKELRELYPEFSASSDVFIYNSLQQTKYENICLLTLST